MFNDADADCAATVISRLHTWKQQPAASRPPFFAAAGFQGPRLSWSYPKEAGAKYPDLDAIPLPFHPESPASPSEGAEWFRPTEVAW
jgi:hypothetical protein